MSTPQVSKTFMESIPKINLAPSFLRRTSNDQAFTSALYNSLAIVFLIVGISLCGLLLIVLQAFVRSILWALLTGAFLFSFKNYLANITCKRLEFLESTASCLSFQVIALPLQLIDSTSDYVWYFIKRKYIQLICIAIAIVLFNFVNYEPLVDYILWFIDAFTAFIKFFVFYVDTNWQISCTLLVGYLALIIFYWNNDTKFVFRIIAIPIWICILILISQILGEYRIFFLIIFFILTCLGIASSVKEVFRKYQPQLSRVVSTCVAFSNDDNADDENYQSKINIEDLEEDKIENIIIKDKNKPNEGKIFQRSASVNHDNTEVKPQSQSNKYFILLFWFYVSVKLWSYPVLSLLIFIILWKGIKVTTIGLSNYLYEKFDLKKLFASIRKWVLERKDVLAPKPFKLLLEFYFIGDSKMNKWLQNSLHSIISAFMILALLVSLISAIILLAMQVQDESLKLIAIISNIFNENLYSHPFLKSLLPEKEKVNDLLQEAISKFYLFGRDWLSSKLKSFISSTEDQKIVEKQLLAQWDLLYSFLSQKTSNITTNTSFSLDSTSTALMNVTAIPSILTTTTARVLVRQRSISSTNGVDWKLLLNKENLNYNHLIDLVKENIGICMSLLDSLYLIIKSNFNILFTIVKVSTSLLFHSGFVLFNFFISFIVYITALFYLLSSSTNRYKPLQWLNEITILKSDYGQLLSKAIEESISSVFVASLKMAAFYGLYTWLIHHIFGLSIAFLPSIFASIFGFLPILSTYWVSLPGILELWLLQHQPFYALLFLVCHIVPTYIVDMAIYSDIKGGHPYFTGLAIVGGIYCLGLEGALIGPIVLCLFIVIIKMNKEILSMSTNAVPATPVDSKLNN